MSRAHAGNAAPRPVRVLIVDDSAVVRQLMTEILAADPGIEVVGAASDPLIARERIKQLKPDVLTLDIEMPRMDGLTFLQNLMRLRPMPVVMVSSLTQEGAAVTFDALALGAVDFVSKPAADGAGLAVYAETLRQKVRAAAHARFAFPTAAPAPDEALPRYRGEGRLIALGASIGGTEAIREVLAALPEDAPAVVIAQHIPSQFSGAFADRLDRHSSITVCEAEDGMPILPGHAFVAPGGRHLRVHRSGAHWRCRIGDDELVSGHRPSVDVLFDSVATQAGARACAALLTGMGDDGARGLHALRRAGAATFAQDQPSSVVWGMPGAAVTRGAVEVVAPLSALAHLLLAATTRAG